MKLRLISLAVHADMEMSDACKSLSGNVHSPLSWSLRPVPYMASIIQVSAAHSASLTALRRRVALGVCQHWQRIRSALNTSMLSWELVHSACKEQGCSAAHDGHCRANPKGVQSALFVRAH